MFLFCHHLGMCACVCVNGIAAFTHLHTFYNQAPCSINKPCCTRVHLVVQVATVTAHLLRAVSNLVDPLPAAVRPPAGLCLPNLVAQTSNTVFYIINIAAQCEASQCEKAYLTFEVIFFCMLPER